jgi:hypothetical protein
MSKQSQTQAKKYINRNKFTQLTSLNDFNANNIIFDEPVEGNIPNTPITFHRVNIGYRNADKTEGELVLELPDCPTFGVQENYDLSGKTLSGYSIGITLGDYQQSPTEEQQTAVDAFNAIVDKCKKHLLQPSVYENCGKDELVESDLRKISPLNQRKDKMTKKIIPDSHYSMYPKLMWRKEREVEDKKGERKLIPASFDTILYDDDEAQMGNELRLKPLECIGKKGRVRPLVKIEGIFVGEKIKIQVKLYAAYLKLESESTSGYKSLFRFNAPRTTETVVMMNEEEPAGSVEETQEEEETFSVPVKEVEPEEEEEEIVIKPKATKGKGKK